MNALEARNLAIAARLIAAKLIHISEDDVFVGDLKALVDFITKLKDVSEYGIFHAPCEESCYRREFDKEILCLAGYDTEIANPDKLRSSFSVLDNMMMRITGVFQMLVVPLVFVSIVTESAAIGDTKTLGKAGAKTDIFI